MVNSPRVRERATRDAEPTLRNSVGAARPEGACTARTLGRVIALKKSALTAMALCLCLLGGTVVASTTATAGSTTKAKSKKVRVS